MKKKVMVVDDDSDIRETVKTVLEKEGYEVSLANSADDALKKEKSVKPTLILMDIMMPGTPVKEIVPKLKSKVSYLSVVKLSEAEKKELKKASKNVVGFIQKPFELEAFISKIKKLTI